MFYDKFFLIAHAKITTLAVTLMTISAKSQPKHYHLKLDLSVRDVSSSCIISGIYTVFNLFNPLSFSPTKW